MPSTLSYLIYGFIAIAALGLILAFAVWFFSSNSSNRKLSARLSGFNMKLDFDAASGGEQAPPSSEKAPVVEQKPGLVNVALNKPVVSVQWPLTIDGKPWDATYFNTRYSINMGLYPTNLTDGRAETLAYPASWVFDYIIDLQAVFEIHQVSLVWGEFGSKPGYITSWKLFSQEESPTSWSQNLTDGWTPVASGDFPSSEMTIIKKPLRAKRFRVVAMSLDTAKNILLNWIGMHEFIAYVQSED